MFYKPNPLQALLSDKDNVELDFIFQIMMAHVPQCLILLMKLRKVICGQEEITK